MCSKLSVAKIREKVIFSAEKIIYKHDIVSIASRRHDLLTLSVCVTAASRNYTSVQPGSNSGLNLILHVNQNDYLYAPSASAGFRVN